MTHKQKLLWMRSDYIDAAADRVREHFPGKPKWNVSGEVVEVLPDDSGLTVLVSLQFVMRGHGTWIVRQKSRLYGPRHLRRFDAERMADVFIKSFIEVAFQM